GDYLGRNPEVPNATRALIGTDAVLRADALENGDGGKVIVWADGDTAFHGRIYARGGAHGGDGGFVETSGKEGLSVGRAVVDTRAPAGRTGTWLLDPHNVTVNGAGAALTDVDEFSDTPAADLALDVTLINTANSNVFVRANNDVEFLSDVDIVNP